MKKKKPLRPTDTGSLINLPQVRRSLLHRIWLYPKPVLFLGLVIFLGLASFIAVGVFQAVYPLLTRGTWDARDIRGVASCLALVAVTIAFVLTFIKEPR